MSEEKTSQNQKTKDGRIRNITMVLYDDSANPKWKELLEEEHIPYMYIYHDRDKNPDGEVKKPHYHLVLCFEGKKTRTQLQYYADLFGSANNVYKEVASIRAMARYLCHLDNPDKIQYDISEVHTCSIDYNQIIEMASDRYKVIDEMISFCEENNVISFYELLVYAKLHKFDWFKCLCDNSTMVMKEYLKSRHWTLEHNSKSLIIDYETGEVIENGEVDENE